MGERRKEVNSRLDNLENGLLEVKKKGDVTKRKVDDVMKVTQWVIKGSKSIEELYGKYVKGKTGKEKGEGWGELKRETGKAFTTELRKQFKLPTEGDVEMDNPQKELERAMKGMEEALQIPPLSNVYEQGRKVDGVWTRIEGTFLVNLKFGGKAIMFADLMADTIDPALRQLPASPDKVLIFPQKTEEENERKWAKKNGEKGGGDGKGKGRGGGGGRGAGPGRG